LKGFIKLVNSLIIQNLGNTGSGDTGSSDIYPFKIEDISDNISKNSQNLAISLETSSKYSSSKALSL
jgi:hypothetical protein